MIIYGQDAQDKLMAGLDMVADTIKYTLGPKARTVIYKKGDGPPIVINDGVSIAKIIKSDDEFIQMGVELLQEVASQAQSNTGDGTTTAAIIARRLAQLCMEEINNGADRILLKKEIEVAAEHVISELNKYAQPIDEDMKMVEWVASIAANNDSELGELISQVVNSIGVDGIITLKNSKSVETSFSIVEGMQIDNGYMSHVMINSSDTGECKFDDCLVLISNDTINNFENLLPALNLAVSEKKPMLIISKELEGTAFTNLLGNIYHQTVKVCAIKAPDWGDDQVEILKDIQTLIGGRVFDVNMGDDISQIRIEDFGVADTVVIDRLKTLITSNDSNAALVEDRVAKIRTQLDNPHNNSYVNEQLQSRMGKLTNGVAVINVGAATEVELLEKKERLDDALNATRAAIQEGIIAGGGLPLYLIGSKMHDNSNCRSLADACMEPIIQLSQNAGIVLDFNRLDERQGFDAFNGKYVSMIKRGIVDPVKVTKSAIRTAVSIVGLIMTTEVLIGQGDNYEEQEESHS